MEVTLRNIGYNALEQVLNDQLESIMRNYLSTPPNDLEAFDRAIKGVDDLMLKHKHCQALITKLPDTELGEDD